MDQSIDVQSGKCAKQKKRGPKWKSLELTPFEELLHFFLHSIIYYCTVGYCTYILLHSINVSYTATVQYSVSHWPVPSRYISILSRPMNPQNSLLPQWLCAVNQVIFGLGLGTGLLPSWSYSQIWFRSMHYPVVHTLQMIHCLSFRDNRRADFPLPVLQYPL